MTTNKQNPIKPGKTWEMWTLSEEDIIETAENHNISMDNVDMDEVARKFKNCIAALIGDNWDECLALYIENSKKQ